MGKTLTAKGRKTRRQIVETAFNLFREEGFDNVSTARICEAAGISNGSFFHYFTEKEDLLYAYVEDESEEMRTMAESLGTYDAQTALTKLVQWQADYYARKGSDFIIRFHSHLIASHRGDEFDYAFLPIADQIISRGIADGQFRKSLDSAFAAELLFSEILSFVTYHTWPGRSRGYSLNDPIDAPLDVGSLDRCERARELTVVDSIMTLYGAYLNQVLLPDPTPANE
jgi:AcrR family transcriptional regulator